MLPDFPQCGPRLAHFRGIDKTEFLDQQLRATAPGQETLHTTSVERP
jgi:hypothetical protein